jgi:hypothetical protein
MKYIFLLGIFVPLSIIAGAQSVNNLNPQFTSPLPPSPSVSAISKYGSIPVGLSTGIPQIDVPIYAYSNSNSGLSLSVSLSYHAGGIRVDEMASNVGLGWSLNAGGVVSRVARGIADECSHGFLNTVYFDGINGNDPKTAPSFSPFVRAFNRQYDIEADIFSFSINGKSGRFTYGRNGDILMLDAQKVKIEREVTTVQPINELMITKFTITDENGIKYIFEATEQTELAGVSIHNRFMSAWYLTQIMSPSGQDNITFEYEDVFLYPYQTSFSETYVNDLYPPGNSTFPWNTYSSSNSSQQVYGKHIKKISLPNGLNVRFSYSNTARTDLPNDVLLAKIMIEDPNALKAKGYLLQQDYSLSGRATLLSVTPFSGMNAEVQDKPYQFFYNAGLPPRFDNHHDHWGYPTFTSLLPGATTWIPREIFPGGIAGKYELPGINRDTDPLGCLAGSLYKIIYPTGGRTEFELEANQAQDGWLSQNFSVIVNDPPYLPQTQYHNLNMVSSSPTEQDRYFTFNGETEGQVAFNIGLQPGSWSPSCSGECVLRIEVFPTTGNTTTPLLSRDFTNPFTASSENFILFNPVKGAQYRIRYYLNTLPGVDNYNATATLTWNEKQAQTQHTEYYSHTQPYVGGLRAKKISDYADLSNNPVSVKEYEYLGENGLSSGILATYPTYTYTTRYEGYSDNSVSNGYTSLYPQGPTSIVIRQSSSAQDIVYLNGSPVGYSRIVERQTANGSNNGKIERFFTTRLPGSATVFPFIPTPNYTWQFGMLTKEVMYDVLNRPVKKTENTYKITQGPDYAPLPTVKNFTSYSIAPVIYNVSDEFFLVYNEANSSFKVSAFPAIGFVYNSYVPLGGRVDLQTSVVTELDPVSATAIVQSSAYEYDPNYYYLKKKKYTNSKGQEIAELYTYPADKVAAGQTNPYQDMLNNNMLNPVIETEQQLNLVKQKKLINIYAKNWPNNTLSILPASIQSQLLNNTPETRITFDKYDSKQNPLSASPPNGVKTCYVWGYNKQYPIAEIKNSDYATVETVLGGANALNSFCNQVSPSDNAVISFLAPLRTDARMKNALVTTHTYAPLYGVTSIADSRGWYNYYEYDGFGRLQLIKDNDGNVIKTFEYKHRQ